MRTTEIVKCAILSRQTEFKWDILTVFSDLMGKVQAYLSLKNINYHRLDAGDLAVLDLSESRKGKLIISGIFLIKTNLDCRINPSLYVMFNLAAEILNKTFQYNYPNPSVFNTLECLMKNPSMTNFRKFILAVLDELGLTPASESVVTNIQKIQNLYSIDLKSLDEFIKICL